MAGAAAAGSPSLRNGGSQHGDHDDRQLPPSVPVGVFLVHTAAVSTAATATTATVTPSFLRSMSSACAPHGREGVGEEGVHECAGNEMAG